MKKRWVSRMKAKEERMVPAKTLAHYVIGFFHESEDLITNLRLQKLLYYIQGQHLGLYGTPVFEEELQAWVHGPVQPAVYEDYKHYRWRPILEAVPSVELPAAMRSHTDEVLRVYGIEPAYALEQMSRHEEPWLLARGNVPHDEEGANVISQESMASYFSPLAQAES